MDTASIDRLINPPYEVMNCIRCHPTDFQIGVSSAMTLFLSGLFIGLLIAWVIANRRRTS